MAKKSEIKRLYRSKQDKIIAGVCGGIAEYFNVDPVWIRLAAVILCFINGIGIILYIIAWLLIPENPDQKSTKLTAVEEAAEKVIKKKDRNGTVVLGIIIFSLGLMILLSNLGLHFRFVWPLALIGVGLYLIIKRNSK